MSDSIARTWAALRWSLYSSPGRSGRPSYPMGTTVGKKVDSPMAATGGEPGAGERTAALTASHTAGHQAPASHSAHPGCGEAKR